MENRLSAEIYALRIKNFLRHIIITYSQFNIMRIKEIKINNFHCYQQTNFQFADRVTILIGKNGSGKSSLIKSIKNALSIFFPTILCGDIRQLWEVSVICLWRISV